MAGLTPLEVFPHYPLQLSNGCFDEAEGDGQDRVRPVVKNAVIVSELEVIPIDFLSVPLFRQNLGRIHRFFDEDRSLPLWGWGEKVKVLPDRPSDGARDSDEVMQPAESPIHRRLDQVRKNLQSCPRLDPSLAKKANAPDFVPDYQSAKAGVGHQNVGALAHQEGWDFPFPGVGQDTHEVVGSRRSEKEIGRPADPERGERGEGHVLLDRTRPQDGFERVLPGW